MKVNYEKINLVIGLIVILIITEIYLLIMSINMKIDNYKTFNSIVVKENILELFLDKEELSLFRKNNNIYLNSSKKRFNIDKIEKISNKDKKYYYIKIRTKLPKKYKDGSVVKITIFIEKEKLIRIIKTCWKE